MKGQIRVLPGICVYEVDVCCGCVLRILFETNLFLVVTPRGSWYEYGYRTDVKIGYVVSVLVSCESESRPETKTKD